MDKLRMPATVGQGSQESRLRPEPASTQVATWSPSDLLPKIFNRSTDADIPNAAWSSWIPAVGSRTLRRPLHDVERQALAARAREIAPALAPYLPAEIDFVTVAVSDMLGGFTSMRQSGDEAEARLDSMQRLLQPYPAWAIVKSCRSIQGDGVWREGKFDRRWPPNDAEVVDAVRKEIRHYERVHSSAVALLAAEVEEA